MNRFKGYAAKQKKLRERFEDIRARYSDSSADPFKISPNTVGGCDRGSTLPPADINRGK